MDTCRLDHLVIAAATLEEGVAYIQEQFGVEIPKGGEHLNLATHNHVMQLGDKLFLELIAPAPALDANPERFDQPRWFGLDEPWLKERLTLSPGLVAWVVNTDDLHATSYNSQLSLGTITRVTRGELTWLFALPVDGRLLAGGAVPYAMQWKCEHPATRMADLGVRLEKLEVSHSRPSWLANRLQEMGADSLVTIVPATEAEAPRLSATFTLPDSDHEGGNRQLVLHSPF